MLLKISFSLQANVCWVTSYVLTPFISLLFRSAHEQIKLLAVVSCAVLHQAVLACEI